MNLIMSCNDPKKRYKYEGNNDRVVYMEPSKKCPNKRHHILTYYVDCMDNNRSVEYLDEPASQFLFSLLVTVMM